MKQEPVQYPDFDYAASQLSAFSLCIDIFIISLKNGRLVKFQPKDIAHFKEWLIRYKVRDIAVDNGLPADDEKPTPIKPLKAFLKLFKKIKNERNKNN